MLLDSQDIAILVTDLVYILSLVAMCLDCLLPDKYSLNLILTVLDTFASISYPDLAASSNTIILALLFDASL